MSNLMIELRYRDIDPDSGLVSNDGLIALVDPNWSKVIKDLVEKATAEIDPCLLYTSPSPRDRQKSRMPSSA